MGVDSDIDGLKANQAFNGDTLILVTFNPNTLTATMFSIPRDMYVPIACNHNRYNKINSSAAYGSSCVINTVKQLTGIDIDYYVKMNFIGVVQLVEALGGVTVDVEEPDFYYDEQHKGQVCEQNSHREFGNNLVCMNPGIQTLNGEQALAYARCRHLYAISDIARNQHQQQIIEAMAQKLKSIRSLEDFEKILNAVSNNLETNMTPEQIMSFYDVGKDMLLSSNKNSTALSIKKTYLAYYSLPIYIPGADRYTSALGYYPDSLNAITKLMKENLGLSKPKPITTFNISYNEDYTTPLVGYGITTGGKLERMPYLIGQSKTQVETWCTEKGITCTFNQVTNTAPATQIVSQSQHEGVLLKPIKTITFEYSDGLGVITPPPTEETPGENPEETPGNNGENNTQPEPTPQDPVITPPTE
jgi:LCP family protein required for cell wall assembly